MISWFSGRITSLVHKRDLIDTISVFYKRGLSNYMCHIDFLLLIKSWLTLQSITMKTISNSILYSFTLIVM